MTNKTQNIQIENQPSQNEFTIEAVEKSSSNKAHHAVEVAFDVAESVAFGGVSLYTAICCAVAMGSLPMPISLGLIAPLFASFRFAFKCGENIASIMNKTYYNQDEQREKVKKKEK